MDGKRELLASAPGPGDAELDRILELRPDLADYARFVATSRRIWQSDGLTGFYAGLPVSLIRVVPNTCVTFVAYELILRWARDQHWFRHDGE